MAFVVAHWMKTLAALGRKEELRQLLLAAGTDASDGGRLRQLVNQAREQYALMLADPQSADQCGLYAMQALARALQSRRRAW